MALTYSVPLSSLMRLSSNDYPERQVSDLHRGLYDYPFDDLVEDVRRNGIKEPLRVVNNRLVDGHHRIIVAKELGFDEIQITYSGYLDKMPIKNDL